MHPAHKLNAALSLCLARRRINDAKRAANPEARADFLTQAREHIARARRDMEEGAA